MALLCYHRLLPVESPSKPGRAPLLTTVFACLYFLGAGLAFIPRLGIEFDEVLFVEPIFHKGSAGYNYFLGHRRIPMMLMSYLGTLKTIVFLPVFHLFGTTLASLRLPPLLFATASIAVFFLLVRRIAGDFAAAVGAALLAADSCYLLTSVFDWGPVVFQHLLIITGAFFLFRFAGSASARALAAGCFFCGLALWDKALAIWLLGGLLVATVVVFPKQLLRLLTPRRAAIAVAAFCVGALPLILYNLHSRGDTFLGNSARDFKDLRSKSELLSNTLSGQGLFGYFTEEGLKPLKPGHPESAFDSAAAAIAQATGHPNHNWMPWALILALIAAPFAGAVALRVTAFALVAAAVAWFAMASTAGAGGTVHHTILLWPLPQLLIAVVFAGIAARIGKPGLIAIAVLTLAVAFSGVAVTAEYYAAMQNRGGTSSWTDAIFPLYRDLTQRNTVGTIYCVDWGTMDPLLFLSAGKLPVQPEPFDANMDRAVTTPGNLFVTHVEPMRFFPATDGKIEQAALAKGLRRRVVGTIPDSFGRPVFEVYDFVKSDAVF